ncbi:MAG: N-acetylneuraminate synthase family protein [Candidatus Cloacimonetes bacterium]|nr:N-acetylneuraminate synthase family protein [Candidatus Cloacimonadota bacterium]
MKTIILGDKKVGFEYPAFIIAEAGINHQGDVEIAKKLIKKAKECGADAVKFQKRKISRILTKKGLEMPYEKYHSFGKTYGEHKKVLELSRNNYLELKKLADKIGIIFCASGWDEESVDFLDELGIPFFKVASADLTNFPLLIHIAKKNKPMIISTGMSDFETVKSAYNLISEINNQIAILQCTSTYPSEFDEIHLNVLKTYQKEFPDAVIGYSGHELGIAIPPVAIALGARIIERHFTLDRTMKGGDHAASLEPLGLSKMIRDIRHIELALGNFDKQVQKSEKSVFEKLSKSIVSKIPIKKGEKITREMLTTKGPGTGISPSKMNEILGKKTVVDIPKDVIIKKSDIEW